MIQLVDGCFDKFSFVWSPYGEKIIILFRHVTHIKTETGARSNAHGRDPRTRTAKLNERIFPFWLIFLRSPSFELFSSLWRSLSLKLHFHFYWIMNEIVLSILFFPASARMPGRNDGDDEHTGKKQCFEWVFRRSASSFCRLSLHQREGKSCQNVRSNCLHVADMFGLCCWSLWHGSCEHELDIVERSS